MSTSRITGSKSLPSEMFKDLHARALAGRRREKASSGRIPHHSKPGATFSSERLRRDGNVHVLDLFVKGPPSAATPIETINQVADGRA